MPKRYRHREKVPVSGQDKVSRTKREVTCVKDEPFPPTPEKGETYRLVDRTKHKK
ncbi:hypothetical protein ES706_02482 [subsurface metagenome]